VRGGVIGCGLLQLDEEDLAVVSLLRATDAGLELAAQFAVAKKGRVQVEIFNEAVKPYVDDLRDNGIWSQKLRRTVLMDDGADFLEALIDSLRNSSYWHASAEAPTPTSLPILASASH